MELVLAHESRREVSGPLEHLCEASDAGIVPVGTGKVLPHRRPRARRSAHGILEDGPACEERIDVGRRIAIVAVDPHMIVAQGINGDQDDVGE